MCKRESPNMDIGAFWGVRVGSAGRSVWTMDRCVVVRFNTDIIGTYSVSMDVSSVRDLSLGMSAHTRTHP